MTPEQLRQTAAFIRGEYPPPDPGMTPGRYVSCEAMYALAGALDHTAAALHGDGGRPSTEGDGGAPDELHALLDFIWARTTEEASGLVSLQGDAAQLEAESYLSEHGGELLRWEQQTVVVAHRIVAAARAQRS